MQPDEDTPFGRHLKEVTKYLNIGIPSITGTYNATLPEKESWKIQVQVPGRTFEPVTEPIKLSFEAPTWSLGKSMAAHISTGRIGEVYRRELKDTIYQICGRRDEQWEMCWKYALEAIIKLLLLYFLVHDNCLLFML